MLKIIHHTTCTIIISIMQQKTKTLQFFSETKILIPSTLIAKKKKKSKFIADLLFFYGRGVQHAYGCQVVFYSPPEPNYNHFPLTMKK